MEAEIENTLEEGEETSSGLACNRTNSQTRLRSITSHPRLPENVSCNGERNAGQNQQNNTAFRKIITDDSDTNYTPLERPPTYVLTQTTRFPTVIESESEDEPQSSSESDSDTNSKPKKAKIKLKPKARRQGVNESRPKKYDIWSTRIQEEVLSETFNSCDVSHKDRSRDVESYDYTLSRSYNFNDEGDKRVNNKRNRNDRKNPNLRLKNKKEDESKKVKGNPRVILDLTAVAEEDSLQDLARDMANKLYEEKEDLIENILNVVGAEKAINLFKKVQSIEGEGGMLIMNQTRRRTPGGVYFFLVKHDDELTAEQKSKIFGESKLQYKKEVKEKQKQKKDKMKAKIRNRQDLPDLLTKAELCVQMLANDNNRSRKQSSADDVVNPPPTPETDCHENSCDGMENVGANQDGLKEQARKLESYEDEFIDINTSCNDMDLF